MSDLKSLERCVGNHPILYAQDYSHEVPRRDGEEFSHMEKVFGTFHVLAITADLARAAYDAEHPRSIYERIGPMKAVCVVDAVVRLMKNYGGHFAALALTLGLWCSPLPAKAYSPTVCHFGYGVAVCQPLTVNPSAHVITVPPADIEADGVNETRAQYNARCKPTLSRRDSATGMQRWTWAEKGCEFGPE